MRAVKYGAYDMQANGCVVTRTTVLSPPTNDIQADKLAERDGALVVKQQWSSKPFEVEGYLRAASPELLDALLDTFKGAMATKNQPFDIQHGTGLRRYLGSAQNIIITSDGLSTASYSVQFLSPDGMGWDVESSALIPATGVTQATASIPFTVGGTYKAEPYIRLVLNSVTGGSAKALTVGNGSSLRSVSITRNWVAGDVVEMDTLKGDVLVNGIPADYRGSLLSFEPGANILTFNDEFTARDITVTSSYTRRWL
jgi:hypothetical protein